MNKPRTVEGRWWIHGDDKPTHFGVLEFHPEKGLILTVKIADSKSTDVWLQAFVDDGHEVPTVIHGADENSHSVTLFGCIKRGHSIALGLETFQIGCLVGILNFKGDSWSGAVFRAVCINFSASSTFPVESVAWNAEFPRDEVKHGEQVLCGSITPSFAFRS